MLAFLGALVAVSVVYLIARVGKTLPVTTLILAGVAIGAFLISVTSYLTLVAPDKTHGIVSWLMGSFSMTSWDQVGLVAPYILAGMAVIFIFARPLNVMQLDEEQAQQLGINVERTKVDFTGGLDPDHRRGGLLRRHHRVRGHYYSPYREVDLGARPPVPIAAISSGGSDPVDTRRYRQPDHNAAF